MEGGTHAGFLIVWPFMDNPLQHQSWGDCDQGSTGGHVQKTGSPSTHVSCSFIVISETVSRDVGTYTGDLK